MSEPTHFEKFVAEIMSDDDSPLAWAKAERDYALHCLEREIAISHQAQTRIDALEAALREIANQPHMIGNEKVRAIARAALDKDAEKWITII